MQTHKSYAPNSIPSAERSADINAKLNELVKKDLGPLTCDAIAQYCGMSKQNVYQIEKRALKRVRFLLRDALSDLRD